MGLRGNNKKCRISSKNADTPKAASYLATFGVSDDLTK